MIMQTERADTFRMFAARQAAGISPLYAHLATAIAENQRCWPWPTLPGPASHGPTCCLNDQPFVYAFGDNLIATPSQGSSPLRRLLDDHAAHPDSWALLAEIRSPHSLPRNETALGPTGHPIGHPHPHPHTYRPANADTPGVQTVVCAARWVFTPTILGAQRCPRRTTGERYLVDAVQQAVRAGQWLRIVPVADTERRYNMDIWPTCHACAADMARPEIDLMAGSRR